MEQIISFAAAHGYKGVEFRGIQRELDLTKSKHFDSPSSIADTKKQFADKGLRIVDLGASCELHHADPATRKKNLDEAKRFIALASSLGCPFIRVFPNHFTAGEEHAATIHRISDGLTELGNHAKGSGVRVLMETHGDLTKSDDLVSVMSGVQNDNAGLVWDICNMWSVTKEPPAVVYPKLKKYIFHTHIKNVVLQNDKVTDVFMDKGEAPIYEAIDLLMADHFKGYYSFEWEKMWHPEIEEPEVALADYPEAMKKHLSKK